MAKERKEMEAAHSLSEEMLDKYVKRFQDAFCRNKPLAAFHFWQRGRLGKSIPFFVIPVFARNPDSIPSKIRDKDAQNGAQVFSCDLCQKCSSHAPQHERLKEIWNTYFTRFVRSLTFTDFFNILRKGFEINPDFLPKIREEIREDIAKYISDKKREGGFEKILRYHLIKAFSLCIAEAFFFWLNKRIKHFKEICNSIEVLLASLLAKIIGLFVAPPYARSLLERGFRVTSAGGIAATSEQHAFSLLSIRLSMIAKQPVDCFLPAS